MTLLFKHLSDEITGDHSGVRSYEEAVWIPLEQIRENPDQPRKHFAEKPLQALEDSVRMRGVLQPIRVRAVEDGFQIVAGERRFRACKRAGLPEIPAVICNQSADRSYVDSLIENLLRENLNAMERAEALEQLRANLDSPGWEQVGKHVGLGKRQILHLVGLRALPETVQREIRNGRLTEKHGRALKLLMSCPEKMNGLLQKIKAQNLTGDEALECARMMKTGTGRGQEIKRIRQAASRLMRMLTVTEFETCRNGDLNEIRNIMYSLMEKTEQMILAKSPLPY